MRGIDGFHRMGDPTAEPERCGGGMCLVARDVQVEDETDQLVQRRRVARRATRKAARGGAEAPVIFECVGAPGMIEGILDSAPLFSRIVVAGVCVGVDRFTPTMAINKELDLRFVFGYTVGFAGVDEAFPELRRPDEHAKILIDPRTD